MLFKKKYKLPNRTDTAIFYSMCSLGGQILNKMIKVPEKELIEMIDEVATEITIARVRGSMIGDGQGDWHLNNEGQKEYDYIVSYLKARYFFKWKKNK